jgi:hypothetical protein
VSPRWSIANQTISNQDGRTYFVSFYWVINMILKFKNFQNFKSTLLFL